MPAGQVFEIADLMAQQSEQDGFWYEFLRSPKLYCGLYVLPAGTKDPQQPHDDDEVYYVVKGSGVIQVERRRTCPYRRAASCTSPQTPSTTSTRSPRT